MNKQCTYLSNDCTRRGKDIWDSYQVMELIDKKKKPLRTVPCTQCVYVVNSCLCVSFVYLFTLFLFLVVGVALGNIMYWGFFLLDIYRYKSYPFAGKNLTTNICKRIYLHINKMYNIHCIRQFGRVGYIKKAFINMRGKKTHQFYLRIGHCIKDFFMEKFFLLII